MPMSWSRAAASSTKSASPSTPSAMAMCRAKSCTFIKCCMRRASPVSYFIASCVRRVSV